MQRLEILFRESEIAPALADHWLGHWQGMAVALMGTLSNTGRVCTLTHHEPGVLCLIALLALLRYGVAAGHQRRPLIKQRPDTRVRTASRAGCRSVQSHSLQPEPGNYHDYNH